MMTARLKRLGTSVIALAIAACGAGKDEAPEVASKTAPRLVGRIASVHRSEGFALVENLGNLKLGEGLLLSTRGEEGRTATLVVSGERLERFAAADLKSGDVAVGDAVYARPLLAAAPSTDLETQRLDSLPDSKAPEGSPSP